jgi:hypothetical protein
MGIQPDRHPGPSIEEELRLEEDTTDPTVPGALRYVSGSLRFHDAVGVFNPRTGSGGITEEQHEILDTLIHELAETSYLEITRSSGRVSSVIVWTDDTKTKKVREVTITRSSGRVSSVVEKHYDATGTLKQTLTHTIARTGIRVSTVATVES